MTKRINFTKAALESLAAPKEGRIYLYDVRVNGLLIQVTAAGAKSFQVYRKIGIKPVRVTLGKFPDLTIDQARRKALATLAELTEGINPNDTKRTQKAQAVTLGEALQAYHDARPGLKKTTRDDMTKAFKSTFPDWLERPLTAITRDMVEARHREYGKRSQARANLAGRYLRAVFNFAIARYHDSEGVPIVRDNPVDVLKRAWFRVERRRTYLKPHELKPWWDAVESAVNDCVGDYFKVLLLTGLRREEGLNLTWTDIDFKAKTLTVHDPKNRQDHSLPLSDYLQDLFKSRKRRACDDFVFATHRGRLSNMRYAIDAVSRASVAFTPHDLRRTFATIADSLDIPGYALKALLNHKSQDVTSGYVIATPERLRAPMKKITDYVLKCAGVKDSADVIELATRQA